MHRHTPGRECRHDIEEIVDAFPAADPARQSQQVAVLQLRILPLPGCQPGCARLVARRKDSRVNPAGNDGNAFRLDPRIMLQQVITGAAGYRDDPRPPQHHRAVGIHGIKAVHSSHETRLPIQMHTPPGQPGNPGRQAGARMQNIDPFPEQQASQARNQTQCQRRFPANRPAYMFRAGG